MAKTTAPLLSFDARGQIAQTQVYATWKGRRYVRRYTIPANPRTSEQLATRDVFTWLQNVFKYAPTNMTQAWHAYAVGKVMTGYNAFTKFNLPELRPGSTLADFIFSPSALSGIPPTAVSSVGGSGTITMTITAPSVVPTGWTLVSAIALAILDQNPHGGTDYPVYAATDSSSPYVPVISGLAAGDYISGGYLEWTRPDGKTAYSAALNDPVTVT